MGHYMSYYGDNNFDIEQAKRVILDTYGDVVSIESKAKNLLKNGRNPNVGSASTGYTIWYTGQDQANETYVADNVNSIDSISSGNTNDIEVVRIEGHTMTGDAKTFVVQTATLNGRTRVALTTPLNRCTRVAHANQSSTNLVGEVYVYENTALTNGKPTDTTKIHLTVPAGKNKSQKASTSLSNTDYWIVTSYRGSLLEKASAFADVAFEVREQGGVFQEIEDVACSSSQNGNFTFKPFFIVPKNADVRLVAVSDSTSRDVSGSIQGYLAEVVSMKNNKKINIADNKEYVADDKGGKWYYVGDNMYHCIDNKDVVVGKLARKHVPDPEYIWFKRCIAHGVSTSRPEAKKLMPNQVVFDLWKHANIGVGNA
jgi:hypothetical protein